MLSSLLQRREQIVARHDATLDRWWPDKKNPEFRRDVSAVVAELETLLDEFETAGMPAIERSRTARWLADAFSDLSREQWEASGEDLAYLTQAVAHYHLAESLMGSEEHPRDMAILNFNYANALRRFDFENVDLLKSAKRRYEAALNYFTANDPDRVPQVREALDRVLVALQLAPIMSQFRDTQQHIEGLSSLLKRGASTALIADQHSKLLEGGGPTTLLRRVGHLLDDLPESVREDDKAEEARSLLAQTLVLASSGPEAEEAAQNAEILSALEQRLQTEIDEGKVDAARQATLSNAVGTIKSVLRNSGDDITTIRSNMLDLRGGAQALIPAMKDLSYGMPGPPAESRAAHARDLLWSARRRTFKEWVAGGLAEGERNEAFRLSMKLTQTDRSLVEAGADDARAMQIEAELTRIQVLESRSFASRLRPYLADPLWSSAPGTADPNAILYSGGTVAYEAVAAWCSDHNITLLDIPAEADFADARWRQVSMGTAGIFDLMAESDVTRAAVAYELGIAQTLGRSAVLVAEVGAQLPFDLDVPKVEVTGDLDAAEFGHALDTAMYWIPPRGTESSLDATIKETQRRFAGQQGAVVTQSLKELSALADDPDPVEVNRVVSALLSLEGRSTPSLITPTWVGVYPAPGKKRLFHVMPFVPDWADDAVEVVEIVCAGLDYTYVRGDRVINPQIVPSIWEEICLASHVLVDLTDFNANVAFELGIAHTLGRPTLIVGQPGTVDRLFPMIAKLRISTYAIESMEEDLSTVLKGSL